MKLATERWGMATTTRIQPHSGECNIRRIVPNARSYARSLIADAWTQDIRP